MPGSNARVLEKARTLAADCLIFDLEDAVAPEAKEMARKQVCKAVQDGGYGPREVIIRINAPGSEWGRADLEAAIAAKPDAILVPKVSRPEDIASLDTGGIAIWAMMETPLAMLNAREIAHGAKGLQALVMGTNDLAKETGASLGENRFAMIPWLMTCVAAARAAGISIIDGVYNDFRNIDGFAGECRQGAAMGMDGKTLIHPGQIGPCNEVFSPSPEAVEQAEKIIAAFELPENAGKGAINLDGRMVELLHCESARRTVAIAGAIAERSAAQ